MGILYRFTLNMMLIQTQSILAVFLISVCYNYRGTQRKKVRVLITTPLAKSTKLF